MMTSIYAKELRTKQNVTYVNVEVIYYDIPDHIKFLIPDAVKIMNNNILEYVSRSCIVSIEMYMENKGS